MDHAAPSASITYYDRSTGLMVFGILTIGLGLLSIGLAILIVGSQALVASLHTPGVEPAPIGALIPGMLVYVVVGIGLIWTGVGSCLARRWAYALMKIFSWVWLTFGVTCFVFMAVAIPVVLHSADALTPANARLPGTDAFGNIFMIMMLGFYSIFLVVLPGVWVWFYNSIHVKMTCEVRDPVARWTDRCPLPVLAVSLWTVATLPMMVVQALTGYAIVPLFGLLLSGFVGGIFFALLAVIWAISGVLMYLLDVRGLWLMLGTMVLIFISSIITYSLHDLTDIYQLLHYPPSMIAQMDKIQILHSRGLLVGTMVVFFIPFLAYLIYLFRFFRPVSR